MQLGAFSQRGSAEALFRKMSGNGALAGRQAFYVSAGAVTRLQGGGRSKAALPPRLRAARSRAACFPVAAK